VVVVGAQCEERIGGILLKTRPEYARTFIGNWRRTGKPQVFLVYDRRPILQRGDLVLVYVINEDRLGFYARFVGSEWVRGFKKVEDDETRIRERERIWNLYGDGQLHTTDKREFDDFWERQDGVRSLVIMGDLVEIKKNIRWKDLMRILHTNFPRGVGYLYITDVEANRILELVQDP
jgi:hypothetical protein